MIPFLWKKCVRLGSSNLIFTAGVAVGLAGNLAVGMIMSQRQLSSNALGCYGAATLAFIVFGYCLHSLAAFVKMGEDAFLTAAGPGVPKDVYAARESWNALKKEKNAKRRGFLFLTTVASPVVAFIALILATVYFSAPPPSGESPKPSVAQRINEGTHSLAGSASSRATNGQSETNVPNSK